MSFSIAIDNRFCTSKGNYGEIIRSAVAFGASTIFVIGGKKVPHFGAHGSEGYIQHIILDSWNELKSDISFQNKSMTVIGICACQHEKSQAIHEMFHKKNCFSSDNNIDKHTVFVIGPSVRTSSYYLNSEQLDICDSLVHVTANSNTNTTANYDKCFDDAIRYVVKVSICFYRFKLCSCMSTYTPNSTTVSQSLSQTQFQPKESGTINTIDHSRFEGEKYVLGEKLNKADRYIKRKKSPDNDNIYHSDRKETSKNTDLNINKYREEEAEDLNDNCFTKLFS